MAIKINGTVVVNDSRGFQNIENLKTVDGHSLLGIGNIDTTGALSVVVPGTLSAKGSLFPGTMTVAQHTIRISPIAPGHLLIKGYINISDQGTPGTGNLVIGGFPPFGCMAEKIFKAVVSEGNGYTQLFAAAHGCNGTELTIYTPPELIKTYYVEGIWYK